VCWTILALGCGGAAAPGPAHIDAGHLKERLEARRGHPTLLVFWATWCKPCVAEIPALTALHAEAPGGLTVLAVSLDGFAANPDESSQAVARFLREQPTPYDQLLYVGPPNALIESFQLPNSIPYAILYDAKGTAVRRFAGPVSAQDIRAVIGAAPQG
jgi:thiol-disulfide isomerase/thioredoxin